MGGVPERAVRMAVIDPGGGGGVCCCVGGDAAVTMELERWEAGGGQGAGAMLGTCIFILRAV